MAGAKEGFLLIADISGYTNYLSHSELEHAQAILTSLLELLVEHTRPPLIISRTAGDAVISYGLRDQFFQGQTFIELIENTYVAFRRLIERMVLNNTCQCNACTNISTLDLKFFVHFGAFAVQHIGEHDELLGSDVNLIHRLLKNTISEKTGWRAYTLYTEQAMAQWNLEGIAEATLAHQEEYEHFGPVKVWVQNMQPVWEAKQKLFTLSIPEDEIIFRVETEIAMAPELVWDYMGKADYRNVLLGADKQRVLNLQHGRVGKGSVYQCYHGDQVIPQTVLEWRPFDHMVFESQITLPANKFVVTVEFCLSPTEKGTRLRQYISKARGSLIARKIGNKVIAGMEKQGQVEIDDFKRVVEADLAAKSLLVGA